MCGLVGIVGANLNGSLLDSFSMMLHLDVVRGKDSTGMAFRKTNTKSGKVELGLLKVEGLPYNLYRKFPEVFDARGGVITKLTEDYNWLMAATVCAVNSANAHPFHHGSIIGCHNGTISSGLGFLPTSPKLSPNCTDSEKIMCALSLGWSLQQVMEVLTGAAALTWWDSSKQTYNLYKNKERPLFYSMNAAKTILAYASESWILRAAMANTRNLEFTKEVIEVPDNEHIQLHMSKGSIREITKSTIVPKVITPYVNVVTQANQHYENNVTKLKNHKVPSYLDTRSKREYTFRSSAGWLDVTFVSKEEFNHRARFGCALCGCGLDYDEQILGEIKWVEKDTPLCLDCSDEFKKIG